MIEWGIADHRGYRPDRRAFQEITNAEGCLVPVQAIDDVRPYGGIAGILRGLRDAPPTASWIEYAGARRPERLGVEQPLIATRRLNVMAQRVALKDMCAFRRYAVELRSRIFKSALTFELLEIPKPVHCLGSGWLRAFRSRTSRRLPSGVRGRRSECPLSQVLARVAASIADATLAHS